MSRPIADAAERARALDVQQSFCVQAPAGSGKTELLTQRILNLLAHCERPEEILAFTFTRKAAAEMRSRLLKSLQNAAGITSAEAAALPDHARLTHRLACAVLARDASQDWQLLNNSQRLRINTIDSFTSLLTGQLPLSANFGSHPRISTDMSQVFEQAIHATLGALERSDPISKQLEHLLTHLHGDLGRAERLMLNLLHKRDQWLPLVASLRSDPGAARALLEANLQAMLADTLSAAASRIEPFAGRLLALLAFAAGNQEVQSNFNLQDHGLSSSLPAVDPQQVPGWRELAGFFLLKSQEGFRRSVTKADGFPAPSDTKDKALQATLKEMKAQYADTVAQMTEEGLLEVFQLLVKLPDAHYSDAQWVLLEALTAILPLLAAELEVAMRQAGQIDHTQTSLAALQALGPESEPTDLALRLDYRIRHILVDEFQDTSSMQFHLLEKLVAGWEPGDGRTLFIVGDGMQSCYGFRNANVGLFLRARDEGIGSVHLEALNLNVNFRSDSSVVSWVNAVFSGAFPRSDDIARGGVCYSPSEARTPQASTPGVHCRFWTDTNETPIDKGSRRDIEAQALADLCLRLSAEDPHQSIAILVSARTQLNCIVPALRSAGLRWNASEIDQLLSYPALNDLFTLLRALLNLADTTAWFALLRAPFVGIALPDIEKLALFASANEMTLWSTLQQQAAVETLSSDGQRRLQRCVPVLQRARVQRQSVPLRALLEYAWIDLGGPACLEDRAILPNVVTFLDLLEEHAQSDDLLDIHRFEKKLQRCFGSAADPAVNLHIMTIHKAKGLEFDAVLLPGLDRTTRGDQNELLLWKEYLDEHNASRPLLAVLQAKGDEKEALYQYLRYEAGLRTALENTRMLYIAVTRAARQAWLFGNLKSGKQGLSAPGGSLLQTVLPQLLAQPEALNVEITELPPVPVATSAAETAVPTLRRLPGAWQSPLPAPLLVAPEAAQPPCVRETPLARKIGELVHHGLKLLVEQGTGWLPSSAQLPFWVRELRPLCAAPAALNAALETVHGHLDKALQGSASAWLFFTAHSQAACELALCDYSGGYRRDFIIDRTFIDASGQRWIIDYKTTTPMPGQHEADFVGEQTALYREQLENYARLLSISGAPAPRIALFFTGLALLHEVLAPEAESQSAGAPAVDAEYVLDGGSLF